MKTVLVTGGAGFIGSHLCQRLVADGHKVISLDNYFTGSKDRHVSGVKYINGHTRDISRLVTEQIDAVYHLGEYSRVEKSFEDPISLVWDLNTAGTFAVLEFCRQQNTKLVYAGSSTKFAKGENGSAMSPYAWSKSANTTLVQNYGNWYGLSYAITYFYNVYGPGEISEGPYATILGIFKKQNERGLPLTVVSPGDQRRNFTHIDDIVDALILVGQKGHGDEYGIGSEESFSVLEVAEMFRSETIMMPARRGNRNSAEVYSAKTKELGWNAKRKLADYISKMGTEEKSSVVKKRVLVFATTFYPNEGLSERALRMLAEAMPDIHFDVITTALTDGKEVVKLAENIHVHTIGTGQKGDKLKLIRQGHKKSQELSKQYQYAFIWSIMASYGTMPAYLTKKRLELPLLITLGDQKIPSKLSAKYWLLRLLAGSADQVSTNAITEVNVTRDSYLEALATTNKSGDSFSNAFRFAYNMIIKDLVK
jgi:UDP-glucose 4-epimerase